MFWKTKTPKKFFMFQETELSYTSGGTSKATKAEHFIFQETELSYTSGGTSKATKAKFFYVSTKKVMNKFF